MKILTNKQYDTIISQIKSEQIYKKNSEVRELEEIIDNLRKEREQLETEHSKIIDNLKKDYEILIKRKDLELQNIVLKETQSLRELNNNAKSEINILKAKNEMYEKAFENLGFDVKDMKDILNKLVDGVVTKNSINVIK